MSFIQEYREYLQNNPEGYWFKRKLYGWGWTPATREGFTVLAVYLIFAIGLAIWSQNNITQAQIVSHVVVPIVLATLVLLLVTYRTGEPLKWQWGKQNKK